MPAITYRKCLPFVEWNIDAQILLCAQIAFIAVHKSLLLVKTFVCKYAYSRGRIFSKTENSEAFFRFQKEKKKNHASYVHVEGFVDNRERPTVTKFSYNAIICKASINPIFAFFRIPLPKALQKVLLPNAAPKGPAFKTNPFTGACRGASLTMRISTCCKYQKQH